MHKSCCIILAVCFFQLSAQCQDSRLDSLLRVTPQDTNAVNALAQGGADVIYQNATRSIPYFEHGLALAKRLGYTKGMAGCYNGLFLANTFVGKYRTAKLYVDSAIVQGLRQGDKNRLALFYLNRADCQYNLQHFNAATEDCRIAMAYAEQVGNRDRLGRIYSVMASVTISQQQFPLALQYLEKAQHHFEAVPNMQMVAMGHSERAEIFQKTREFDKAMVAIQRAIQIADSVRDIQHLSTYHCILAQLYFEQRQFGNAREAADKTRHYALQTGNRIMEAVAYDLFYHFHMHEKSYGQAIADAHKAYELVKVEHDLAREHAVVNNLAEGYHALGDDKNAYHYLSISKKLKDSLVVTQYSEQTAQLQASFQVAEKDKEIELLGKDRELQQQRMSQQWTISIAAFVLVGMALTAIGLLINRYRLRQRMKELELRNRIAADLHDEIGSSLSSISMLSQVAARQPVADHRHQQDILARVSTNAQEAMEKMGDIVWTIKPNDNDDQSLVERMERYAYEMCALRQVTYTISGKEQLQLANLTMQQRRNVYLIFKEALNNAVKYSGTPTVAIGIEIRHRRLALSVEDHGTGFDPSSTDFRGGNGLKNMRRRAEEIGGTLTVASTLGGGTRVSLEVSS